MNLNEDDKLLRTSQLKLRSAATAGKLHLTFTLNREKFMRPSKGFDVSRDKLQKVFYRLRKGVVWEGKLQQIDALTMWRSTLRAWGDTWAIAELRIFDGREVLLWQRMKSHKELDYWLHFQPAF